MFKKHIKFRVKKTNITKFAKRKTTSKLSFEIINKTKIKITLILHIKRLTLKNNTTKILIVFDTILCRKMKRSYWCFNSNSRWKLYNKNLIVIYTIFIRKIKRNSLKSYSIHLKKYQHQKVQYILRHRYYFTLITHSIHIIFHRKTYLIRFDIRNISIWINLN